jgi:hypothetical protein
VVSNYWQNKNLKYLLVYYTLFLFFPTGRYAAKKRCIGVTVSIINEQNIAKPSLIFTNEQER